MVEEIDVVIKEPKTFKDSLKLAIYLSWLMGTGICRPGKWKKVTIFLKIFHFLMCTSNVAYGIVDYLRIGSVLKGDTYKAIYYMNKAVIYITSYYYVIFGLFNYKQWTKFVEKFDWIDKKIRRETSINDRWIKINQFMALGVVLLLGPISLTSHVVYYYFTAPQQIVGSDILVYYIFSLSLSTNLTFDVIVHSIYHRFKIVNKLIKQIGDSYTPPWIIMKIQRLKEMHHGLCALVHIMSEAHGLHLLLSSGNSFMMVVSTLFRIYMGVTKSEYDFIMINNVIWIVYASQFAINCYVCTLASREASRTGIYIHEIALRNNQLTSKRNNSNRRSLNYNQDTKTYENISAVQNEIAYFSSQLEQNPVAFNACNFFVLNNALLQSFIGVITTYLIILIQFHHPESDHKQPLNTTTKNFMATDTFSAFNITEEYYSTRSERNYSLR